MPLRFDVIDRVRTNGQRLLAKFDDAIEYFDRTKPISGPSAYFHLKTIRLLKQSGSPTQAVQSSEFLEALYATLASWGMHITGDHNVQLVGFPAFSTAVVAVSDSLGELKDSKITEVSPCDDQLLTRVWGALRQIRVAKAGFSLVASSKVLHHLLPELVPPIDARHTIGFFVETQRDLSIHGENVFRAIFPELIRVARGMRIPEQSEHRFRSKPIT